MTSRRIRTSFLLLPRPLFVAVAVGLSLAWAAPAQAQRRETSNPDPNQKSSPKVLAAFRKVVSSASQGTTRVLCEGKDTALGTIVGADGWILTKASELKGKIMCKLKDGRELEARIAGVHEGFDLALLKVEAQKLTPVDWRESKLAPVGNWVASAGIGEEPVAVGVVSVATRTSNVRPPAVSGSGTGGGFLGISLEVGEGGAKISQVSRGSAAEKAGLKIDDIMVAIEGKAVVDPESLSNTIQSYRPGDVVVVKVKRGTQEVELKATLDKRPPNMGRSDFQNQLGSTLSNRRTGFPSFLQHDTVIKPSDCGGPLVDLDGKVIGINIARAGRTESYAIPSEAVLPLMYDLMSGKLAPTSIKTEEVKKTLTPEDKVAEAKAALQKAEADRAAAEARVTAAKAALQQAEAELKAAKKTEPK